MGKIVATIGPLPIAARRSFGGGPVPRTDPRATSPFDRGSGFVTWPHLRPETGARSRFCDPRSPHRKGVVGNANRRARRWLPRERDMRQLTDADIRAVTDRMNATPRKCPG
jgi:IS30 family transposase